MAKAPAKAGKKKSFKRRKSASSTMIVHIQATFNNTIVTIADLEGNTISWSSAVRWASRLAQGHSVRRAAGGHDGGQQGFRKRSQNRGSCG